MTHLLTKSDVMYHKSIRFLSYALIITLILFIPESCTISHDQSFLKSGQTGGLLKDIKSRGKLVSLTDDNSLNYFTYEGEAHGFQYDLLQRFATHLGVSLEIIVEPNAYKALQYLQQRRVDIIAMELPTINDDNFDIAYTSPLYYDYQVLVQQKPQNWFKIHNTTGYRDYMVNNPEDLKSKSITISANKQIQCYLSDIQHLTENEVEIVADYNASPTQLFEDLSYGEIDYTLAYETTAKALCLTYTNLDSRVRVSPQIGISWVVRKGAVNLHEEANNWIEDFRNSREFASIKSKYHNNPRWVNIALGKPVRKKSISDYDEVIKQLSNNIDWDWRLVAALIYQESKFNMNATSYRGAFGLMQLMPATAIKFGASINSSATEQIAAGIRLINHLDKRLSTLVPNDNERKKFVLAAYNIGLAHILDAISLAEKHGKDPTLWSNNVEYFLLAKSKPEYYNDPVVKYGKISGRETHRFVLDVMDRYEHYKALALK
jgi:membrane-bound lytic murein transglycosylase F